MFCDASDSGAEMLEGLSGCVSDEKKCQKAHEAHLLINMLLIHHSSCFGMGQHKSFHFTNTLRYFSDLVFYFHDVGRLRGVLTFIWVKLFFFLVTL